MIAGSFVPKRPVDDDEIWRLAHRNNLARRGYADEQLAAGGKEFLGHQHGEGGTDRAIRSIPKLSPFCSKP